MTPESSQSTLDRVAAEYVKRLDLQVIAVRIDGTLVAHATTTYALL